MTVEGQQSRDVALYCSDTEEGGVKLWHYTAIHHLDGTDGPGILRVGILGNVHPWIALPAHVWLTDDDRWAQEWAETITVGCDRNEARIEVAIPHSQRAHLHRWATIGSLVTSSDFLADLNGYGRPDRWWVYSGDISRGWLRRVEYRPANSAAA